MTKRIVFEVPDEVAEQMTHRSVFLDVFGTVRWSAETAPAVEGATRWVVQSPVGADRG